ncbi:MAG: carbamoyltransferase [Elusimicrobia bacterium]|nr:carbamoyltransferase [Elusimicrobiota bacterium]
MNILGVSCHYHDSAAALIQDGELVAAAEEERFTRKKHDSGFPSKAIAFCLGRGGVKLGELDYVAYYEKPFLKFERILTGCVETFPRSGPLFRRAMKAWLGEKLWIKSRLSRALDLPAERVLFCDHHLSHAASAFFCSPFEDSAVLTMDGVGEWASAALGKGEASWREGGRQSLVLSREIRYPHSIGLLYSAFTAYLGFEVNDGEYKVMGMAPYGEPRFADAVRGLVKRFDDGSFKLRMDAFAYHYDAERSFTGEFERLFGAPRAPGARFVTRLTSLYDDTAAPSSRELEENQRFADVAASVQLVTEELVLGLAKEAKRASNSKNLCLAGGVALNSVANGRVWREAGFERVFIQPAAGDSGGALGAALYAYHALLQKPRRHVMTRADWGKSYSAGEAADALRALGAGFEAVEDEDKLLDRVAQLLKDGKVVGWHQGRFEWGPRALGHRSILADPRSEKMKDTVNIKIKFREPFRPFAPSVLSESAASYFELGGKPTPEAARFMLMTMPVKDKKRAEIPAVTHVDGSSRIQTVGPEGDALYRKLIARFQQATGVGLVLNTSFNLKGEPIVNTPAEAFATFMDSGMDALVVGPCLLEKGKNQPSERRRTWRSSEAPDKSLVL